MDKQFLKSFKLRIVLLSLLTSGLVLIAFAYFFISTVYRFGMERIDCELETIAGSGKSGFSDGKGLKATFNQPYEIIITKDCKTMYVAGAVNYLIRRITVK